MYVYRETCDLCKQDWSLTNYDRPEYQHICPECTPAVQAAEPLILWRVTQQDEQLEESPTKYDPTPDIVPGLLAQGVEARTACKVATALRSVAVQVKNNDLTWDYDSEQGLLGIALDADTRCAYEPWVWTSETGASPPADRSKHPQEDVIVRWFPRERSEIVERVQTLAAEDATVFKALDTLVPKTTQYGYTLPIHRDYSAVERSGALTDPLPQGILPLYETPAWQPPTYGPPELQPFVVKWEGLQIRRVTMCLYDLERLWNTNFTGVARVEGVDYYWSWWLLEGKSAGTVRRTLEVQPSGETSPWRVDVSRCRYCSRQRESNPHGLGDQICASCEGWLAAIPVPPKGDTNELC